MEHVSYTIYDGDPAVSGPSHWPAHENVPIRGRHLDTIERQVVRIARQEAKACRQYQRGDSLWYIIWHDDQIARSGNLIVSGR